MKQPQLTFEEVVNLYRQFLAERDWGRKEPKNYAISLSLESNELLEHFQWSDDPVGDKDELAAELADIMLYAVQFADCYDIDIPSAMIEKIQKAAKKYPATEFRGKSPGDQRTAWRAAKKRHIKTESL